MKRSQHLLWQARTNWLERFSGLSLIAFAASACGGEVDDAQLSPWPQCEQALSLELDEDCEMCPTLNPDPAELVRQCEEGELLQVYVGCTQAVVKTSIEGGERYEGYSILSLQLRWALEVNAESCSALEMPPECDKWEELCPVID